MGLKLVQDKVSAGHLRKMGDTKDLTKKSNSDMATIFGVRADAYSSAPPPLTLLCVITKRRTTLPYRGNGKGAIAERNKRRRDKNRDDDNGSSSGAENNNKRVHQYH